MAVKTLLAFLICISLVSPAHGDRAVTLPHTEDFTDSDSIDDIIKLTAGNGATVTRVAESWRGGGNYCAKITPPTCTIETCPDGNGKYAALGAFTFTATSTITVAFALNVGTTYSSSAANVGGSLINKFIDIFNGSTRTGLFSINNRGSCGAHEIGLLNANTEAYFYYAVPPSNTPTCAGIHFGDGVGTGDLAGDWIWLNYTVNNTTGRVTARVWDRNGEYSYFTFYIDDASDGTTAEIKTIGGYYNESHPTADENSRLLIDDLAISTGVDAILPPDGFVSGSSSRKLNNVTGVRVTLH